MTSALVTIRSEEERVEAVDKARAMLEQARNPVEAKTVHDLARAAQTYARLQKLGEEAVAHARAIATDALALMGAMLAQATKNPGVRTSGGGEGAGGSMREPPATPTLAEQGIDKKASMLAQALATVKVSQPELYEKVKTGKATVTAAHAAARRVARERAEPVDSPPVRPPQPEADAVPDAALMELAADLTALVSKVTRLMRSGSPSGDRLKTYLQWAEGTRGEERQRDDGTTEWVHSFVQLAGYRYLIELAARPGPLEVRETFQFQFGLRSHGIKSKFAQRRRLEKQRRTEGGRS